MSKMANEKLLIDAERFNRILQRFEEHLLECGKIEGAEAVKTIIKGLKTEPNVDAVEVVHGRWEQVHDYCWANDIVELADVLARLDDSGYELVCVTAGEPDRVMVFFRRPAP